MTTATAGMGIYLTGSNVAIDWKKQKQWEVSGNWVYGPTSSATGAGITLRAEDGICSNNYVEGFSLGLTADRCYRSTIIGNRCVLQNNLHKCCYELLGMYNTFVGNYGRPSADGKGLSMSSDDMSFTTIANNVFEHGTGDLIGLALYALEDVAVTADTGDDDFTTGAAHDFRAGSRVIITHQSGSLPGGVTADRVYWVVNVTETTFQISETKGGSAVTLTTTGSNVYARYVIQGMTISGNSIDTNFYGIQLKRHFNGVMITGNTIQGPGHSVATSVGIQLDTMTGSAVITGNRVFGVRAVVNCYAAAAQTYDDLIVTHNNFEGEESFANPPTTLSTSGSATLGRVVHDQNNKPSEVDAITATNAGVAASLATLRTEVTTNGDEDEDSVTLANGYAGQVKHIYCVVEGHTNDTWSITPATMCGGTKIAFAGAGEGCILVYADNEGWVVTGNNGGTIS